MPPAKKSFQIVVITKTWLKSVTSYGWKSITLSFPFTEKSTVLFILYRSVDVPPEQTPSSDDPAAPAWIFTCWSRRSCSSPAGEKLLRPDLFGVSFQERWRSSFISRCQRRIIYSSGICFHCSRRCGRLHLLSNTHNAAFIFHRWFFFLPSFNSICILFSRVNRIPSCPTDSGVRTSRDHLRSSLVSRWLFTL